MCEAEIKATDECTKNIQWLPNVLDELNLLQKSKPTLIYNDNRGAIDWANTSSTKGMQYVSIRENCVREAIHEFFDVMVSHIGGKMNPADLFTKEHKSDEIFCSL